MTSTKKNKQQQSPFPMLMSVEEVLKWALLTAGNVAIAVGITVTIVLANIPLPCSQTSKIFHCPGLTPTQEAHEDFFFGAFLWFTAPQAVAAAAGLLLPRRRAGSRWLLALVAQASAAAAHYMMARAVVVFVVASPGNLAYNILTGGGSVFFLAVDLRGLLSLVLVGGGAGAE